MKRILVCGTLLALATSLSFAQRGRAVGPSTGGVGPAVGHVGPAVGMPSTAPMAPTTGVRPDTVNPDRVAPSVSPGSGTVAPDTTTVGPDTGKPANPASVGSHTSTVPDRAVVPDANDVTDHTRINPNQ